MNNYLIEFRFQGRAKKRLKEIIWDVDKTCRIGNANRKRPVPHISLAIIKTNNERKLIGDFARLCTKTDIMSFTLKHFSTFEDNKVVYFDINPDKKLDEFRWALSKTLQPYCTLQSTDQNRKYHFHSTIAMRLTPRKFQQVKSYVQKKKLPHFKNVVMRVTLLKNNRILKEYDFMQRKLFDRNLAKSRYVYNRSVGMLMDYIEGKKDNNIKKDNLLKRIKNWFSKND